MTAFLEGTSTDRSWSRALHHRLTLGSFVPSASHASSAPLTDKFVDAKTMERFDYLLHHKGRFSSSCCSLSRVPERLPLLHLGLGHLTRWSSSPSPLQGVFSDHVAHARWNVPEEPQYYRFFLLSARRCHRLPDHRLPGSARAVPPKASRTAPSEEGKTPKREQGGDRRSEGAHSPCLFPLLSPFSSPSPRRGVPDPVRDLPIERARG